MKSFKSLSEGTIKVLEQTYRIQQKDYKRELIYDNTGKLITTRPYNLGNITPSLNLS